MSTAPSHLFVTGGLRTTRREAFGALAAPDIVVSCNAKLRGPYSGTGRILEAVMADAQCRWPELVDAHRVELLTQFPSCRRSLARLLTRSYP
jgi:hypothetical protein